MIPEEINWIPEIEPHRLAIMPRPNPGEGLYDNIAHWKNTGVRTIVCLLEDHEFEALELTEERSICELFGIDFVSFPIADRSVPVSVAEVQKLVNSIRSKLELSEAVLVHCHGGIGRSALICACVLLRYGFQAHEVFPVLTRARGFPVPHTDSQFEWIMRNGASFRGVEEST